MRRAASRVLIHEWNNPSRKRGDQTAKVLPGVVLGQFIPAIGISEQPVQGALLEPIGPPARKARNDQDIFRIDPLPVATGAGVHVHRGGVGKFKQP